MAVVILHDTYLRFILTLLAYCPLLTKIWHCTGPAGARRGSFATYVALFGGFRSFTRCGP